MVYSYLIGDSPFHLYYRLLLLHMRVNSLIYCLFFIRCDLNFLKFYYCCSFCVDPSSFCVEANGGSIKKDTHNKYTHLSMGKVFLYVTERHVNREEKLFSNSLKHKNTLYLQLYITMTHTHSYVYK